jgi:hypothetical protein
MASGNKENPMHTIEIGAVFLNERKRRFEFHAHGPEGRQPFGHYTLQDAEAHREQYAARLRRRGYVVVVEAEGGTFHA